MTEPRWPRRLRPLTAFWRPLRFASLLAALVGTMVFGTGYGRGLQIMAFAIAGYVLALGLHRLRWPSFSLYHRWYGIKPAKRTLIEPTAGRSASWIAWNAARPAVSLWVDGRHSRGRRVAAVSLNFGSYGMVRARVTKGEFQSQSGAGLIRSIFSDDVSSFTFIVDELASRLSPEELDAAASAGTLPAWFWSEVAHATREQPRQKSDRRDSDLHQRLSDASETTLSRDTTF